MTVDVNGITQAVVALPVTVAAGFMARRVWDWAQPKLEARAARVAEKEVRREAEAKPVNLRQWWLVTGVEDALLLVGLGLAYLGIRGAL
jgi:hypothetical protein